MENSKTSKKSVIQTVASVIVFLAAVFGAVICVNNGKFPKIAQSQPMPLDTVNIKPVSCKDQLESRQSAIESYLLGVSIDRKGFGEALDEYGELTDEEYINIMFKKTESAYEWAKKLAADYRETYYAKDKKITNSAKLLSEENIILPGDCTPEEASNIRLLDKNVGEMFECIDGLDKKVSAADFIINYENCIKGPETTLIEYFEKQ